MLGLINITYSHNYGARYYDANVGRFLTVDTVVPGDGADPMGFNRYAYARNNPIKYTDPTGHLFEIAVEIDYMNENGTFWGYNYAGPSHKGEIYRQKPPDAYMDRPGSTVMDKIAYRHDYYKSSPIINFSSNASMNLNEIETDFRYITEFSDSITSGRIISRNYLIAHDEVISSKYNIFGGYADFIPGYNMLINSATAFNTIRKISSDFYLGSRGSLLFGTNIILNFGVSFFQDPEKTIKRTGNWLKSGAKKVISYLNPFD